MNSFEWFILGAVFSALVGLGVQQKNGGLLGVTAAFGIIATVADVANHPNASMARILTRDLAVAFLFAAAGAAVHANAAPYLKVWPWNWWKRKLQG